MGLTARAASHAANRWLSVTSTNVDFSAVAAGLTVNSTTSELEMTGRLSAVPQTSVSASLADGVKGMSVPQIGPVPVPGRAVRAGERRASAHGAD
jgi:hypothetical protein